VNCITEAQAHMMATAIGLGLQVTRAAIHPHSGALALYGPLDQNGRPPAVTVRIIERDGSESYRSPSA
jgi:hypothetical protein